MHPSIQTFIHLLLSIQLFVYLSISSFYSSIYSTSCKEIQYRCSVLQTPQCKSNPMVSKSLEISCEKNQIKPYFQDCVLNFTRERAWNAKWAQNGDPPLQPRKIQEDQPGTWAEDLRIIRWVIWERHSRETIDTQLKAQDLSQNSVLVSWSYCNQTP